MALTQLVLILAGTDVLDDRVRWQDSMTFTLDNELDRRHYDMRIFFASGASWPIRWKQLPRRPNVAAAEAWYTVSGTVLREGETGARH
ncbi:MAG: hypothetical protein IPF56_10945 [Chloroflexi bacterium]|nr:hypothetical protein [Chloroflexota bacterium]